MFCFENECVSYSARGCRATEYYLVKPNGEVVYITSGSKWPEKYCTDPDNTVVQVYYSNRMNIRIRVIHKGRVGVWPARQLILDYLSEIYGVEV